MLDLPPRIRRARRTLVLQPQQLALMSHEAWTRVPNETGGILLGHSVAEHLTVTDAIGPGPHATHDRYTFTPGSAWQAEQVALAWQRDSSIEYLGDWHTHPGGAARFSPLDIETAQTIADAPDARQPNPVMLVIALRSNVTTKVAAAQLHDKRLTPLRIRLRQLRENR